jgi:hypothetical protein
MTGLAEAWELPSRRQRPPATGLAQPRLHLAEPRCHQRLAHTYRRPRKMEAAQQCSRRRGMCVRVAWAGRGQTGPGVPWMRRGANARVQWRCVLIQRLPFLLNTDTRRFNCRPNESTTALCRRAACQPYCPLASPRLGPVPAAVAPAPVLLICSCLFHLTNRKC